MENNTTAYQITDNRIKGISEELRALESGQHKMPMTDYIALRQALSTELVALEIRALRERAFRYDK